MLRMSWVGLDNYLLSQHKLRGMDSSLGFKVISKARADANMDEDGLSDGASTGFEIQGTTPEERARSSSNISLDTASFHTADGLESDYPREHTLTSDDYAGDDLSNRLLQQGAQYFSAVEGDSDTEEERSTLRADRYMLDPDQPKLALAEDSVHPSPSIEKQPPPQADEYHGNQHRHGNQHTQTATERSPLISSKDGESTSCCTVL